MRNLLRVYTQNNTKNTNMKTKTIIHLPRYPKANPLLSVHDTVEWDAVRYYNSIPTQSVAKRMGLKPRVQSTCIPEE